VDIRRSIATTITPRFVLLMARTIAGKVLHEQRRLGAFEALPVIDRAWLFRWKRDKGIVFRKPNQRYKCARPVLLARLRAMWLNVVRVRRLAEKCLGHDLSESFWGLDEKPLHFNESGSKAVHTLELAGAPVVSLKSNHAASRERCTLMTMVTSDPVAASSPCSVPCEILFKAKTDKRTRSLKPPEDLQMSVAFAEKGSYRLEHLLQFMRRHLVPWSVERSARSDYKVLMLDMAASHIGPAVVDLAWSRGYVVLYHYGCTTGVCQVNDTDLHGHYERIYLEAEQCTFTYQQMVEPGSVSRKPADVLEDAASAWRCVNHSIAARGHLRTGLTVPLDGSGDFHLTREALSFWRELDMSSLRAAAIAEVDAQLSDGSISSFADWSKLVQHPTDPGIALEEGAELDGDLAEGEKVWADSGDEALEEEEAAELQHLDESDSSKALVIEEQEGDDEASVADAHQAAKRLRVLRELSRSAREAHVPAAVFHVDRELSQLERGLRSARGRDKEVNQVLRRALDKQVADEMAARKAQREEVFKVRKQEAEAKAAAAAERRAAEEKKAAEKERQDRLDRLPKTFRPTDVEGSSKKAVEARKMALERLHLFSPPLSDEDELQWHSVRDDYAVHIGNVYKHASGVMFINKVTDVIEALGQHWKGSSGAASKSEGNPAAFSSFFPPDEASASAGSATRAGLVTSRLLWDTRLGGSRRRRQRGYGG
jgi:hypothetical protein